MTRTISHQTPEGQYVHGLGVKVEHSMLLGITIVTVTDEEMAANALVRSWVEALVRAADTGQTEVRLRREVGA